MVLLDCCHAGGVPALKKSNEQFIKSPVPPELLNVLDSGNGKVVVASSREDEYSYTDHPYSIFTACLLEALSGKASVLKDGYARILDILIYLLNQVPKRASGSQHPFIKKVLDLDENFPLCYYAGGSKFLPGDESQNLEIPRSSMNLSAGQRRRKEEELDILQQTYNLQRQKVMQMRKAFTIEAGTAVKFQLEQQLIEEELALAQFRDELDKIEQILQ